MTLRVAKTLLVLAVAGYYTLVVFDNLTDYDSNYQFVRHVLMMDSTFPGNHGMWRAMNWSKLTLSSQINSEMCQSGLTSNIKRPPHGFV